MDHVSALLRVCEESVFTVNHERLHNFTFTNLSSIRNIIRQTGGERLRDGKEELPFQLFGEGRRGHRDPHDGYKDGEAEPGRFREIHRLCPHTAWEDQPGKHRQPSSVVRKPSERSEVIEIRGTEERRG